MPGPPPGGGRVFSQEQPAQIDPGPLLEAGRAPVLPGRRFHAPQPQALPVEDGGPGAVLYREHDVGLPGLTPGADPGSLACSSRASGCVLEDVTEDHAEIRVRHPGAPGRSSFTSSSTPAPAAWAR